MLNPSLHHGHVESPTSVMPRMIRALLRINPGLRGGASVTDQALVTWVRGSESALHLDGKRADAAFCLKRTITRGIREPAHAEYPSR